MQISSCIAVHNLNAKGKIVPHMKVTLYRYGTNMSKVMNKIEAVKSPGGFNL